MMTKQIDRGKFPALHLLHQLLQFCAETGGLGFVFMHDGVFKQRIQPLDLLNRLVSLWHRHLYNLYCVTVADPSETPNFFENGIMFSREKRMMP